MIWTMPTESFADAHNSVFLGTSVVSGLGTALVTATGRNTAFGDIAVRLASRAPETEFERGIKGFGMLIMKTVFFLVLFIVLVGVIGRHQPFETVALCDFAGRWSDPGVLADDHDGDAGAGCSADGEAKGDRQTPGVDPELWQHRYVV